MTKPLLNDVETMNGMSDDGRAVLGNFLEATEFSATVGMSQMGENFESFHRLGQWAGAADNALKVHGISSDLTEGEYAAAVQEASKWVAEEVMANGLSDVLQQSLRTPNFGRGLPQGAQGIWADAVAGHISGAVMDAVEQPTIEDLNTQQMASLSSYGFAKDALEHSGLSEHGHFKELPSQWGAEKEGDVPRLQGRDVEKDGATHESLETTPRPVDSTFPEDLNISLEQAISTYLHNCSDTVSQRNHIFAKNGDAECIGDFRDFAQPIGLDLRAGHVDSYRFNLDVGDQLGTDLRDVSATHVGKYIDDTFKEDKRLMGGESWQEYHIVSDRAKEIAGSAQTLEVELRERRTEFDNEEDAERYDKLGLENHAFENGHLNVSQAPAGAVLIGRDGGRHRGGDGDDISLDASEAIMGAGDDLIILDNESGYSADGGAGDDIIVGGRAAETLRGGEGKDVILAGDGDTVLATAGEDREDILHFEGLRLEGPKPGRDVGNHGESYALDPDGTTLRVQHEGRELVVKDFTDGDFGISLQDREAALDTQEAETASAAMNAKAQGWLAGIGARLRDRFGIKPESGMSREDAIGSWRELAGELGASDPDLRGEGAWRLRHPDTIRALEDARGHGIERLDVEFAPDMDADTRAAALVDGLENAYSERGLDWPRVPHRSGYESDHPEPGSERALIRDGDPDALEREAASEAARERSVRDLLDRPVETERYQEDAYEVEL